MSRFDYVKYDDTSSRMQLAVKRLCVGLDVYLEYELPAGQIDPAVARDKAMAIRALEVCYMWCGKAIRDHQLARNGSAELAEERGPG